MVAVGQDTPVDTGLRAALCPDNCSAPSYQAFSGGGDNRDLLPRCYHFTRITLVSAGLGVWSCR